MSVPDKYTCARCGKRFLSAKRPPLAHQVKGVSPWVCSDECAKALVPPPPGGAPPTQYACAKCGGSFTSAQHPPIRWDEVAEKVLNHAREKTGGSAFVCGAHKYRKMPNSPWACSKECAQALIAPYADAAKELLSLAEEQDHG